VPYIGPHTVYATPGYQNAFAHYDSATPKTLVIKIEHEKALLLPLLMKQVGKESFEAYSPYGYGGVISDSAECRIALDAESIKDYLSKQMVTSVFLRHSPFLNNHQFFGQNEYELNRITYIVDLQQDITVDQFCQQQDSKLRWSISYARRHGIEVHFCKSNSSFRNLLKQFYHIYLALMVAKNVPTYYLFSFEFFCEHFESLSPNCELAIAKSKGEVLGGAIFIFDNTGWAHYHLSAATQSGMKMQVMELIISEALVRYGCMGYSSMHLGGGHAIDQSDGLSRFKKKFASRTSEFMISKWVCDKEKYEHDR
jgi:lipid II:glycine glycyltransferase (peptidoglycan interpeptide bridge formation enzyme)